VTLRVVAVAGLVTVQDLGRPGFMHQGVPPGGALVPAFLRAANGAVGNAGGDAALEVLGRVVLEATDDAALATEDGEVRRLRPGETLAIEPLPDRRVRYVAIRGGIDAPIAMGSRSTLVIAGLGGFAGRGLRRGDELVARSSVGMHPTAPHGLTLGGEIAVASGPDGGGLVGEYVILPASNRVGTRLWGPAIAVKALEGSAPLVKGAIEVPPDGMPIVLGPEHPTTGGYPVVGVLRDADLDRFFALPVGSKVRFRAS
jgi:allophanate hydrolase subunit 2